MPYLRSSQEIIILCVNQITMKNLAAFIEKLKQFACYLLTRLSCLQKSLRNLLTNLFHILLFHINPFWIELFYFITLSSLGFFALKALKTRSTMPKDIDIFFTSVSAATASSMSTVEMEVFSNTQLIILIVIIFHSGKVFTSIFGLYFATAKMKLQNRAFKYKIESLSTESEFSPESDHIELGVVTHETVVKPEAEQKSPKSLEEFEEGLKFKSIQILTLLISCYLLLVHLLGSVLIFIYLSLVPSAKNVLNQKGLSLKTFSIFATVSTFANCGFLPTNENMMVFKRNSVLLLILIPQVLIGNTLYPACLRFAIFFLEKFTQKSEFRYMLKNPNELGYRHLFSGTRTIYLTGTIFGFIVVQLVVFCLLEWDGEVSVGISGFRKVVGFVFQVVNSRHAGESVFGLSDVSSAMLVLFVLMMYLPEYTSFLPMYEEAENISTSEEVKKKSKKEDFWEHILFSQLSYLTMFTILICIIEREQMKRDPLNFNVFNIVFEVISAYGNVGFSVGYTCERQVYNDGDCKNAWYGFAGKWSDEGKFILIVVMFFGRLKKFNMRGGRAWIVS